jgi:hypothetical protein
MSRSPAVGLRADNRLMRTSVTVAVPLALGVCLAFPVNGLAQERCVAGELALPADTTWTTKRIEDLPEGREGCRSLRVLPTEEVVGRIVFRATPKGTPEIADAPHPRLMLETIERLAAANVRIGEPKWRKLDVPFSGLPGFGDGTMFGFDGEALDGAAKWDVVFLVFDGPAFHYDVSLLSPAEVTAPEVWRANVDGFRALLSGLNKAARQSP